MLKVLAKFTGGEVTMTFIDNAPDKKGASLAFSDRGKRFEVYACRVCGNASLRRETLVYRVALLAQDLGVPQDDIINHTPVRKPRTQKIDPAQGKLF